MSSLRSCAGLAALLLAGGAAMAQSAGGGSPYDLRRGSWIPYTTNGYAGLSLGRPSYRLYCSASGCNQPSVAGHAYLGGMFSPFFGGEVGYLNMGEVERGGGDARAEGVNFSLVGRASVGAGFGVFGRVGATYGRTRTEAAAGSGISAGRASGWGPSYGLGVDWSFSDNWSAVLDWQRHRFDFAGDETGWVRATSIGLKYRF